MCSSNLTCISQFSGRVCSCVLLLVLLLCGDVCVVLDFDISVLREIDRKRERERKRDGDRYVRRETGDK